MELFKRMKHSEYARHSIVLMAGTVFSMLLQTVSFAWLGKWYSDEFMGIYQYFATSYSILLIIATGRYELAIMLPKDDNDGFMLTLLSAGISIIFSVIFGLVLLVIWLCFRVSLDWIAFLPFAVGVLGIYYSCNYWLNRNKKYNKLALNRVIQGILFVFFNVSFAFILPSRRFGLILGYICAQACVMIILIIYLIYDYRHFHIQISIYRIKELAKEYIKFPKISAPSGIINTFAVHLPVFLLGALSGKAVVGQYSMMNKVLGAPITVISAAIRDVFRQKASRDYAEKGECYSAYRSTFKSLALTAIIPFAALMIFAVPAFHGLFGSSWNMAAFFIVMMSPFYYVKFIVSPLTYMTYIAGKQKFDIKWQISFCLSSAISFLLGWVFTENAYFMMLMFGISQTILYIISFWYTKKLSKGEHAD